jgi:hypothetical protein
VITARAPRHDLQASDLRREVSTTHLEQKLLKFQRESRQQLGERNGERGLCHWSG